MLLRVLLIGILISMVARAFWRVIDGIMEGASGSSRGSRQVRQGVKLVRDPVCGTFVAPGAALSLVDGRNTHYFCSDACRRAFTDQR